MPGSPLPIILLVRHAPHHFEEFEPGRSFMAGPRQVTRADIEQFSRLSGDHTRLHSDDVYAAGTPFGRVVAHGVLNLAVATGLAYECGIFEGTVLAVAGMEIRFERPVFPGDSVALELTVVSREDRPRIDRGRVTFRADLRNEAGRSVIAGTWTVMVRRLPQEGRPSTGDPTCEDLI